ncbi:MAG: hypothetical protein LUQ69_01605 [Methanoregulaceae archaeon]|nr:hypothetical protein [Methanoregulaceae archaeon]
MACRSTTASLFAPQADFNDPIQGAIPNCAFIAALSSLAWIYWPKIMNTLSPTFYNLNANGDASGTLPVLAVEKQFDINAQSSDAGIWPAVYEKAYIKDLRNGINGDAYYCDVSKSEFSLLWPQKTGGLVALTGWTKAHYNPSSNNPGQYIYTSLSDAGSRPRPKFPMVAWTKTALNWPDTFNSSQPVSDTNRCPGYDQMLPDHCYSILGTIYQNPLYYIVLRNPRGIKETYQGQPYSGTGHLLPETTVMYAGGTMYAYNRGAAGSSRAVGQIRLDMNTYPGLFAIRADQFQRYFLGYGRVY